jgi:hypothetical protein
MLTALEETFSNFSYKWTVLVILLILQFFLLISATGVATSIRVKQGFTSNPYASRLPTVVDSGLTNTNVLNWGNGLNASVCPSKAQADAYLAKSGNDYYSDADYDKQGFLGHIEAPVFYDIGDVRKTRDTRARNTAPVVTVDQVSYIPVNDANGNQVVDANGMPTWQVCPSGMRNVNNTCQPMQEGMEAWGDDNRSTSIEGMRDEDLINR